MNLAEDVAQKLLEAARRMDMSTSQAPWGSSQSRVDDSYEFAAKLDEGPVEHYFSIVVTHTGDRPYN